VFLSNVPITWTVQEIKNLFADFGEITHAQLATPENEKTQKGTVTFSSKLSCSLAIKSVHGMKVGGGSL